MSRRTGRRLLIVTVGLFLVLPVGLFLWLWFTPIGTGEVRESPDGRFTAHAFNMRTGTITGSRSNYIQLRVVENSTGLTVWKVEQHHADGADVPDYERRDQRYVTWSADSTSVAVPIASGRELILVVP